LKLIDRHEFKFSALLVILELTLSDFKVEKVELEIMEMGDSTDSQNCWVGAARVELGMYGEIRELFITMEEFIENVIVTGWLPKIYSMILFEVANSRIWVLLRVRLPFRIMSFLIKIILSWMVTLRDTGFYELSMRTSEPTTLFIWILVKLLTVIERSWGDC
jgi:hypothetical protein